MSAQLPPDRALLNIQQHFATLSGIELVAAIARGELPPPPMASTMPFKPISWSNGQIGMTAIPATQFYNMHGTIHGGWVMTMLDTSMALAALTTLEPGETCPSTETSVKFVRPLTLASGNISISGQVINRGKSLITLEGKISDEKGRLCAHGTSTCMIVRPTTIA